MESSTYPIKEVPETESPEKSSETASKASSALANDGSRHNVSNLSTDAVEFVPSKKVSIKSECKKDSQEVQEIAEVVSLAAVKYQLDQGNYLKLARKFREGHREKKR